MFHFTANLKPYTFLDRPGPARFDAYLLSADYAAGLSDLAAQVRSEERVLVADNGNVDLLRELQRRFQDRTAPLDAVRRTWEKQQGRYTRPGELPEDLRNHYAALAHEIAAASGAATNEAHTRQAIVRQTAMDPTFLIGMEDLTLGTLAALNIEPEYAALSPDFYEARVTQAITFAELTRTGAYSPTSAQVLAGLHAIDFDTAVLAGRLAAEAGLPGVSVGLFGALTGRDHTDFRVEDGQVVPLARAVPRTYLRVIEIAAGIIEGFRRAGRGRPAFHALGAGTPILLPLLALLDAGAPTYFATDSTAPIVDGWSSPTISLYVDEPAPLKLKAYKVAATWIADGRGWDCDCRDCTAFHDAHPPDLAGARRWWNAEGRPKINKRMLEREGPLSRYLPFLAYSADDGLRREAGLARVGHNHTLLQRLESQIRARQADGPALLSWVTSIVTAYKSASGSEAWAVAVEEAFQIARRYGGITASGKASLPT